MGKNFFFKKNVPKKHKYHINVHISNPNNLSNNRQELESQKEHLICKTGNHLQRNYMKDQTDKQWFLEGVYTE